MSVTDFDDSQFEDITEWSNLSTTSEYKNATNITSNDLCSIWKLMTKAEILLEFIVDILSLFCRLLLVSEALF